MDLEISWLGGPWWTPIRQLFSKTIRKKYKTRQNLLVWEGGNRKIFKQLLFLSITSNTASTVNLVNSEFKYFGPKNIDSQPLYISRDIALLYNHSKTFSGFASSNSVSGLDVQTNDGSCHLCLESMRN